MSGQAGSPSYVARGARPWNVQPQSGLVVLRCYYVHIVVRILSFYRESVDATMETIKSGEYDLEGEEWNNISCDAKEVVRRLLVVDPAERACATEAKSLSFFSDFNDTNAYILTTRH